MSGNNSNPEHFSAPKLGGSPSSSGENQQQYPRIEELLRSKAFSSRDSSSHSSPYGTKRWKNDEMIVAFRQFLSKNFSLENLDAYHEIEQFKINSNPDSSSHFPTPSSNLDWAKRLFDEYCDTDSPFQLNLDFSIRTSVREALSKLELKRKNSEEYSVPSNLFDSVQRAIFVLLQEDSYPKFIKSDIFRNCLEGESKEEKEPTSSKVGSSNSLDVPSKRDKKDKKEKKSGSYNPSPHSSFLTTEPITPLNVELNIIVDKCNIIIDLLKASDEEAAEEYIFALRSIKHEIDQLIRGKIPELSEVSMKELRISLRDLLIIVENLESNSRLVSSLNIYRSWSRIRISQLVYQICKSHHEMTMVVRALLVPYVSFSSNNSNKNLQLVLDHPSLDSFWKNNFGPSIYVPFEEFIKALSASLKQNIAEEETAAFKQIIDHSNQNIACKTSFGSLLKIFGPLSTDKTNCYHNLRQLYRQKWFFGFLSKGEAEALLYDQSPGTFMCRIPKMNTNSVYINYVDNKKRICLYSASPKGDGISVMDHHTQKEKSYSNIFDFVRSHNLDTLKTPLATSVPFEPWYWGDISTAEAIEIITGSPESNYIFAPWCLFF
eukprot:TRINITY_DN3557_c0_g2_i2.p1 TRINITY_DN3557_c0_g2~~TRINITY_DN3557_c0_g2_i2.p1  ORF type:complete len:603 (-),score=128.77 TRINITY_DN3557_c0_g2_i2:351-2159(-)